MSSPIPTTIDTKGYTLVDSGETQFVKVEKIGEKTQYFFKRKLLSKFFVFEHNVHDGSSNFLAVKSSSCIEVYLR